MTELAALRDAYRTDKAALLAQLGQAALRSVGVSRTLAKLTRLTDALLTQLWQRAALDASGGCLMAVGGYGRGELLPHSDVDVLVLLPDTTQLDQDTALQAKLEAFIGSCWDVGLEIGSSVRTLSQCLAESDKDITVQTALLESRRITGQAQLAKTFAQAYTQAMDAQAFFTAKTLELRQRHTKYEDTPYALEPNCKESPGGLRDLQIILWVAKAAGLGHTWDDLVQSGIATALEATQLRRNEALLTCIRARLHLVARRREDRLVFDLQTAVAESFGMQLETTPEGRLKLRASEKLMREYYWAAKAVMQLNQIL
ncbi:MAG: Bifunctional uridylyltransferase/uridylyl-removing enzyme, partial [Pseudomonadota bacterium]